SAVGDVDGNGFADVIVGAPGYGEGEPGEGAAFVFHGIGRGDDQPTSLPLLLPGGRIEANLPGYGLASAVSGIGDINGDGFADVVVGHRVALIQLGGGAAGRLAAARALHGDGSGPVAPWSAADREGEPAIGWEIRMLATHPGGRGRVGIQLQLIDVGDR